MSACRRGARAPRGRYGERPSGGAHTHSRAPANRRASHTHTTAHPHRHKPSFLTKNEFILCTFRVRAPPRTPPALTPATLHDSTPSEHIEKKSQIFALRQTPSGLQQIFRIFPELFPRVVLHIRKAAETRFRMSRNRLRTQKRGTKCSLLNSTSVPRVLF